MHILARISSFHSDMDAGVTGQDLGGRRIAVGSTALFMFELFSIPVQPDLHVCVCVRECLGEPPVREGVHGSIDCRPRVTKLGHVQIFQVAIGRNALHRIWSFSPDPFERTVFREVSLHPREGIAEIGSSASRGGRTPAQEQEWFSRKGTFRRRSTRLPMIFGPWRHTKKRDPTGTANAGNKELAVCFRQLRHSGLNQLPGFPAEQLLRRNGEVVRFTALDTRHFASVVLEDVGGLAWPEIPFSGRDRIHRRNSVFFAYCR